MDTLTAVSSIVMKTAYMYLALYPSLQEKFLFKDIKQEVKQLKYTKTYTYLMAKSPLWHAILTWIC